MKSLTERKHAAPITQRDREVLTLIRLERGWSYTEMAERIGGMTGPTLFRIVEDKQRCARATTMYRIRRFLDEYA